ncbi:TPA: hypothetical protein QHO33_005064 [Citrobacter freundii]|jgi:hypothetical protein|uniref:hypothetical protein n=1 Tax=Enterobacteriaceae TaxID=543 RepID=UPI00190091F8|nr:MULTISPECIES: hypothetical protein [Citrobacter freundii complex]EKJ6981523.1 hypothetical protein [Enterobacter hormaechei]MDJ7783272.1 hypothetical protein [Salmonella enterica]HBM2851782.1 hypothetical protein [Enterobacter hormaechei subsp. xiangfangensis]EKV5129532.1 hypothetical protein [Citrobacter freundii]ELZ9356979.1 hypothetical protein [Citrobacter freundii]
MPSQIQVNTKVNSQSIRRETYNGREHVVIPSYTLPANVIMNREFYPEAEIAANYQSMEGTIAPLGHPTVDGHHVSAFSPEGLCTGFIGAWNRNVSLKGNRVYSEKWVDVERAMESPGGQRLMGRITALENGESSEPIWSSVAVYREQIPAPEELKKQGADWVVKIHSIDHDAILLDEPPAAGPEKGVGLMVNADQAISLQPNSGALIGESYRERESRLDRAVREKFASGPEEYAWVADFTDTQVVIVRNGGKAEVYGYSSDGGKIKFDDSGTAVARQESWVTIAANKFKALFTPQEQPATNHKTEGDMPLTKEDTELLRKIVGEAIAANNDVTIKPLSESIAAIQTNQQQLSEALTANSRAEEKTKREAVAKVHGEIVANALSGEALDAMFKTIGESAPLGTNSAQQQKVTGAPNPDEYFK